MSFQKSQHIREVRVVVIYPHLYHQSNGDGQPLLDPDGKPLPTKFIYTFTVLRKADQDVVESERALGNGRRLGEVHKLAKLLLKEPEGFADFPMDARPLADRVIEYFTGLEDFAEDALLARSNAIYPQQLFRES